MVHLHNGKLRSTKKEILPFTIAWMDLDNIMLGEITKSKKGKYHMISLFKKKIVFIFRQRGREGEREGEKHQCVDCNPGMFPDQELNWRPFGSQASTQSTDPHQPGRMISLLCGI